MLSLRYLALANGRFGQEPTVRLESTLVPSISRRSFPFLAPSLDDDLL